MAAAACTQHEDNKSAFMTKGIANVFVAALGKELVQPGEVIAVCKAVRRLTTADDARPVVSRLVKMQRLDRPSTMTEFHIPVQSIPERASARQRRVAHRIAGSAAEADG